MQRAYRDIVVTGLGAVSAVAGDVPGLWRAVVDGRGGIAPITRFATDAFQVHTGALVPSPEGSDVSTAGLCRRFAAAAAREAVCSARLADSGIPAGRLALVFGTGLGDLDLPAHLLAEELADALGLNGPRLTVSTACSSSTGAIGLARDLLAQGAADAVIAGGADVVSPEVFAGFHALGVLAHGACAPFSLPFGTTLGEGAGFLVLERADGARRRGAAVLAALAGFGLSGDAYHETSPDPKGAGTERAIGAALRDAALTGEAIGYVNVHGSGTEANDPAEWRGIRRGLGAHADRVPVSSSKGALGHAQGAAGALEAIVTIAAMSRGVIPPTLNFTTRRPHGPPDPVPGPQPRAGRFDHALSLNAAFGGANVALVLSRPNGGRPARARRPVFITGIAPAAGGDLATLAPHADPRGIDPTSYALTAAAACALLDAGIQLRGPLRDAAGLLVGQLCASPTSLRAFRDSITERGPARLSATAFAHIVLNAAAGTCSKLLGLRGPLSAISTGAGGGLMAVVLAAELLATREDVALMVAAGVDEPAEDPSAVSGSCVLLEAAARDGASGAIRVLGWGIAGPGDVENAVGAACAMAGAASADAPRVSGDTGLDAAGPSVLAVTAAVQTLRAGTAARLLVTSGAGRSAATALLLAHD